MKFLIYAFLANALNVKSGKSEWKWYLKLVYFLYFQLDVLTIIYDSNLKHNNDIYLEKMRQVYKIIDISRNCYSTEKFINNSHVFNIYTFIICELNKYPN